MANSELEVYEAAVKIATALITSDKWGKLTQEDVVEQAVGIAMDLRSTVRERFSRYR